jgi:hypothetical protein
LRLDFFVRGFVFGTVAGIRPHPLLGIVDHPGRWVR